jgi:hypothetical protein
VVPGEDSIGQVIEATVTGPTLATLPLRLGLIPALLDDRARIRVRAEDAIWPAKLADHLATLGVGGDPHMLTNMPDAPISCGNGREAFSGLIVSPDSGRCTRLPGTTDEPFICISSVGPKLKSAETTVSRVATVYAITRRAEGSQTSSRGSGQAGLRQTRNHLQAYDCQLCRRDIGSTSRGPFPHPRLGKPELESSH